MFNLEGFIPKLCQFTQEEGKDEREKSLRAAGLQALSSMVPFLPNFNTYFLQNVELWSFQNQWHFAYIEQWEILIKEAYLESYCSH